MSPIRISASFVGSVMVSYSGVLSKVIDIPRGIGWNLVIRMVLWVGGVKTASIILLVLVCVLRIQLLLFPKLLKLVLHVQVP